jgi:hypothetical protein
MLAYSFTENRQHLWILSENFKYLKTRKNSYMTIIYNRSGIWGSQPRNMEVRLVLPQSSDFQ